LNVCFQTRQLPLRVGCRPSLLTKAAIQAACSLNVGNLRDTGHSTEATPPAAMADNRTHDPAGLNDRNGLRIQPELLPLN